MMPTGAKMTKRARLRATLEGRETDRRPIAFWHHFPGRDRTADALVASTLAFQQRYDLDLVKLMPTGMYCVLDYGATVALRDDAIGTTGLVTTPISSPASWARLPAATPDRGELKGQVEVVRRVRAALGPDVPIVETIFSPLTIASKLGGKAFVEHLRTEEGALQPALDRLAEDLIAFGRACLEAGADGFFFGNQHAHRGTGIPADTFERVGASHDLRVLEALAEDERSWLTILSLYGVEPLFELADRYPVHVVHWDDREAGPSIRDASRRTKRAMMAGIAHRGAVVKGDAASVVGEVRDAIDQAGGRPLIVAPGSAIPAALVMEETLLALRRAIE